MIIIQDVLVILVRRKASEEGEWDSRFNVLFITLLIHTANNTLLSPVTADI